MKWPCQIHLHHYNQQYGSIAERKSSMLHLQCFSCIYAHKYCYFLPTNIQRGWRSVVTVVVYRTASEAADATCDLAVIFIPALLLLLYWWRKHRGRFLTAWQQMQWLHCEIHQSATVKCWRATAMEDKPVCFVKGDQSTATFRESKTLQGGK